MFGPTRVLWLGGYALSLMWLSGAALSAQEKKADDKTPAVEEIVVEGLPTAKGFTKAGAVFKPAVISNQEELAKAIADEEVQKKIKQKVNFRKQKLLYFRWSGSGQDRLTATARMDGKAETVTFAYSPGFTRDLRQHAKLFAVRRNVEWTVVTKQRKIGEEALP